MYLFTDQSDLSTFLHESAHIFRRTLSLDQQVTLAKVFGDISSAHGEERFARGFEHYLTTGKAPTQALQSAFRDIRSQMLNVYGKIKGSDIEENVDPRLRKVFDRMLGQGAPSTPNLRLPSRVSLPVNPQGDGKKLQK